MAFTIIDSIIRLYFQEKLIADMKESYYFTITSHASKVGIVFKAVIVT